MRKITDVSHITMYQIDKLHFSINDHINDVEVGSKHVPLDMLALDQSATDVE